jgi:hypothetical protein
MLGCTVEKDDGFMQRSIVLVFALASFLTACGSNNNVSPPPSGSIAGNWQMSLQPEDANLKPAPQSGFLLQTGNLLSGSQLLTDPPCSGVANVTGTIEGTSVTFTENTNGIVLNLTGTVGTGQSSMSGTYTVLSSGCSNNNTAPQTGTWIADLVAPLVGNFQGTYTSHQGSSYTIAGQISQAGNTGTSSAALTGTFNIAGYCFATANITGIVSGTTAVMNLTDSSGAQIGELSVTNSLNGTLLTGTLSYLGEGSSGTLGCRAADDGTITLTL